MNRNLISSIIRRRLIAESVFLIEDRIPSLITKYSGTRKIKSHLSPEQIIAGMKPTIKEKPILSTDHDPRATSILGGIEGIDFDENGQMVERAHPVEKIVRKIAEADPTQGKEYTDRMLHWYSRSGIDRIPLSHAFPKQLDTEQHTAIRKQLDAAIGKEIQENHSTIHKFKLEDLGRATDALEVYHRVKNSPDFPNEYKDFNKINSLHHLETIVEPHRNKMDEMSITGEEKSRRNKILKDGASIIHEDDDVRVYHVKNKEASCELGKGTRWCVSATRNNMFNDYNETSPMVMVLDKKGKFNRHLSGNDNGSKSNYRKYMFHFGTARNPNIISGEHGEIDLRTDDEKRFNRVPAIHSDHQLMDEADHDVNYDKFVKTFPQLKNIPHLQYVHNHLFQSEDRNTRIHRISNDETAFTSMLNHMEKHKDFHQGRDGQYSFFTSFLKTNNETSSRFNRYIGDSPSLKRAIEHEDHPIYKHFFGSSNGTPPSTSFEDTKGFVAHLVDNHIQMHDNVILRYSQMSRTQQTSESSKNRLAKLAQHTQNTQVHNHVYDTLTNLKHDSSSYDFLESTTDHNLLQRAYKDTMSGKHEDAVNTYHNEHATPNKYNTKGGPLYYIALNKNTPDHILHELAASKPLTSVHEDDPKSGTHPNFLTGMNPRTGLYTYSAFSSTSRDHIGTAALNTLLTKMKNRGGA